MGLVLGTGMCRMGGEETRVCARACMCVMLLQPYQSPDQSPQWSGWW